MNKALVGLVAIIFVVGALFFLFSNKKSPKTTPVNEKTTSAINQESSFQFSTPKKSAHYESNTPAHASVLAAVPPNVVVDVNFDLVKPSEIKILKDAKDYAVGETIIDENKLAMRRNMDPQAPDGVYEVAYTACWPDKTCHDGHFQFAIDRSRSQNYIDMRGNKQISINLEDIAFNPRDVLISKGTRVTWVNNDSVEPYVPTHSHPAHTSSLEQHPQALKGAGTYPLVFNTSGAYPYHCSAHEATMKANIVVE